MGGVDTEGEEGNEEAEKGAEDDALMRMNFSNEEGRGEVRSTTCAVNTDMQVLSASCAGIVFLTSYQDNYGSS